MAMPESFGNSAVDVTHSRNLQPLSSPKPTQTVKEKRPSCLHSAWSVLSISWKIAKCRSLIWLMTLGPHHQPGSGPCGNMIFNFAALLAVCACQCKGKGRGTVALMHIHESTPWLVTVIAAGSTAAAGGCHSPIWALQVAIHPSGLSGLPVTLSVSEFPRKDGVQSSKGNGAAAAAATLLSLHWQLQQCHREISLAG